MNVSKFGPKLYWLHYKMNENYKIRLKYSTLLILLVVFEFIKAYVISFLLIQNASQK